MLVTYENRNPDLQFWLGKSGAEVVGSSGAWNRIVNEQVRLPLPGAVVSGFEETLIRI